MMPLLSITILTLPRCSRSPPPLHSTGCSCVGVYVMRPAAERRSQRDQDWYAGGRPDASICRAPGNGRDARDAGEGPPFLGARFQKQLPTPGRNGHRLQVAQQDSPVHPAAETTRTTPARTRRKSKRTKYAGADISALILGVGVFWKCAALVIYDIYLSAQLLRLLRRGRKPPKERFANASALSLHLRGPVRWRLARRLVIVRVVTLCWRSLRGHSRRAGVYASARFRALVRTF